MTREAKKLLLVLLGGTGSVCAMAEVDVFVPFNGEGNTGSTVPFLIQETGLPSMRYQQVYDAARFSRVSPPGAYITAFLLHRDSAVSYAAGISSNLQINFSTTSNGPDRLSLIFSENVGADDTVVLGPTRWSGGSSSPYWDMEIHLTTPFWYNPALGNLLMDVRIYGGAMPWPSPVALDAQDATNDSISSVYAYPVGATTATSAWTGGLVTGFRFFPIPSLEVEQSTNSIVLTWSTQPDRFVLQSSAQVGLQAKWQPVTNEFGGNVSFHTLTLPRDSLTGTRYFRLFWASGRPVPESAAPPLQTVGSIKPESR
jgi:hypothetical protein